MKNVQKAWGLKLKNQDFDNIFFPAVKKFANALSKNIDNAIDAQFNVIIEECRELQTAYKNQNKLLILDGVVDVIWTALVYDELVSDNIVGISFKHTLQSQFHPDNDKDMNTAMRQYHFESFIGLDCEPPTGVIHFKSERDIKMLVDIVRNAYMLARIYPDMDIDGALIALAHENNSKLNYPPNLVAEVFRENKLQKKDKSGNNYPWYQPANFYQFVAT